MCHDQVDANTTLSRVRLVAGRIEGQLFLQEELAMYTFRLHVWARRSPIFCNEPKVLIQLSHATVGLCR